MTRDRLNRLVEQRRSGIARIVFPAYLTVAASYLAWRAWTTAGWEEWYLWLLLGCETVSVAVTILYLATTRRIALPEFRPAPADRIVDIFIPTYNEPENVVKMTAIGALHVRGARRVFVLDDGARLHIRTMAESLGAVYLSRRDRTHAKAGNMNAGMRHSDAEFMLFLDCDHVPQPNFIERTLGYFADPRLAFVQTPQLFYNVSSVQFRATARRPLWNEQTMFYESIQPSKNAHNAAFFCGSGALVRRAAIDSIGGFATGTATEDIHTSLKLHAKGWRSLFVPEQLAHGIAPPDLAEYHKQRTRWGAGSLGLLLRSEDSPLWAAGLTPAQRICYFNSTFSFVYGLLRLFYILFPAALLISIAFTPAPAQVPVLFYLPFMLGFVMFSCACAWITSAGTYHPLFTEQFNIANIFSHAMALRGIFEIPRKFSVSAKLVCHRRFSTVEAGILILAIAVAAAGLVGFGAWLLAGRSPGDLLDSMAGLALFWNSLNLLQIVLFLLFLRHHRTREKSRCALAVPGLPATLSREGYGTSWAREAALTALDLDGATLTVQGVGLGREDCTLAFDTGDGWLEIAAHVHSTAPMPAGGQRVHLRFRPLSTATAVAVTLFLFHRLVPHTLRYGTVPARGPAIRLPYRPTSDPVEAPMARAA